MEVHPGGSTPYHFYSNYVRTSPPIWYPYNCGKFWKRYPLKRDFFVGKRTLSCTIAYKIDILKINPVKFIIFKAILSEKHPFPCQKMALTEEEALEILWSGECYRNSQIRALKRYPFVPKWSKRYPLGGGGCMHSWQGPKRAPFPSANKRFIFTSK